MIFDLDGTLLNTIGDLAAAANHTLAEMGFAPHTEEEYKYMVGNGIPKLIERFLPPGHRDKATQAQAARLFFPYYDAHKEDATAPYPGIPALLAALHGAGVKLGVVSNKEDALTKSVVSHYFPGLFDAVAGHTLGTPTKPDPHLVNGMRAAFGLSAQQVLYVGVPHRGRAVRRGRVLSRPQPGGYPCAGAGCLRAAAASGPCTCKN